MRESLSRAAVVRAARSLLSNDGPGGLSLRRLAARLNVTAAALYAYVDNKGDLLHAVLEHEVENLQALFEQQMQPNPLVRTAAMCRAYVAYACGNAPVFRVMFLPRAEPSRLYDERETMLVRQAFGALLVPVTEGIEQGLLREQAPYFAHQTLWTAVHGTTAVLLIGGASYSEATRELSDSVIYTVLRGLCTERGMAQLAEVEGGNYGVGAPLPT